ncbi:MAG: cytochrome C [Methylococcaceae bacterium]|nr:cytochrome C [Methylococcaceae bacterium]
MRSFKPSGSPRGPGPTLLFAILTVFVWLGCLPLARAGEPVNAIDKVVLHPSIPLLDENGSHVLKSGKPYSPKMSCGVGSGCHDYEGITHAYHFEMGREEADDGFGKKRGWPNLVSTGWFGGFNCMNNHYLAKKDNTGFLDGDYGAPGMVKHYCAECHTGGGWGEKDRNGLRYDQKDSAKIPALDGDYYNATTNANNGVVLDANGIRDTKVVSQWDWKKSGVREADCLMCHADYANLKKFDPRMGSNGASNWPGYGWDETSAYRFMWKLRNWKVIEQGFFREAASATLEFIDIKPDTPAGMNLVNFEKTFKPGGEGKSTGYNLDLGQDGKPILHWNPAAFDANGKVQIPMVRFPENENCWQCHHTRTYRGGFYAFGDDAKETRDKNGVVVSDYKDDVHKGKTFIEANGEKRSIENCNACHSRGYYREAYANVDLNANHNFPKGNSDMDLRNDLDYRPDVKSCEYCHDQAQNKVIPSGQKTLLDAHLVRWQASGDMAGYPQETLTKITQVHMDVVGCQTCHISGLKEVGGSDFNVFYRYRQAEDGKQKIVPYKPAVRSYWVDKTSGHVLSVAETDAAYEIKKDAQGQVLKDGDGNITGILKDPDTGKSFEEMGWEYNGIWEFYPSFGDDGYEKVKAYKKAYDKLLQAKGYTSPNAQLIYFESNEYLISHNTRPSSASLSCDQCHAKKQDGSYSALLSDNGLLGAGTSLKAISDKLDPRLIQEGAVVLAEPYYKLNDKGEVRVSNADILYATKRNPSMSGLNNAIAKDAAGEWAKVGLSEDLDRVGVSDAAQRQSLGLELGSQEAFVFSLLTGDAKLRPMAVLSAVSPMAQAILPMTRLQVEVSDLQAADNQAIASAGLGKPASAVYRLKVKDQNKKPLTDFNGQSAWVKLPYTGMSNDPKKINVIARNGGAWGNSGMTPTLVHPMTSGTDSAAAASDGYVVFAAVQPFDAVVLTESQTGEQPGGGGNGHVHPPTKTELAKAKSAADKAERSAVSAEKAAAKTALRAQAAMERAAKATGAAKAAMEKTATRARSAAAAAQIKAASARSKANEAKAQWNSLIQAAAGSVRQAG